MRNLFLLLTTLLSFSTFAQLPINLPKVGLVGYWSFSGNANDMSGNNNNGVPSNVVLTTDRFGKSNNAYFFNGLDSRIEIDNKIFDVGWHSFTISCWANSSSFENPNNYNDSQIIFNTMPHNGIGWAMYNGKNPFDSSWNNKYVFLVGSKPENRNWDVVLFNGQSIQNRTINTWNHLVLVKKGPIYSMYINGELDKVVIGNNSVSSFLCKMVFGNIASGIDNEGFLGKLDDFGVWNRALTESEIKSIGMLYFSLRKIKQK